MVRYVDGPIQASHICLDGREIFDATANRHPDGGPDRMAAANDVNPTLDVCQLRRTLQASLAKLMDAQDYIAGQLAALASIESQVRILALRESSRSIAADAAADELRYLCDLQEEANTNFRIMRQTYADLGAQIEALMQQHAWLYDSTFAQGGERTSDQA